MTEKELSIVLREMARTQRKPLCDEWYGEWKDNCGVDILLNKYVRGIDFCIENDYPSLDFIRRNFKKEDLHRHHIYLDENVSMSVENGTYIFLGECTGTIMTGGYNVISCYIRHDSKITISASFLAKAFVSLYENGSCETQSADGSIIKIYDRRK